MKDKRPIVINVPEPVVHVHCDHKAPKEVVREIVIREPKDSDMTWEAFNFQHHKSWDMRARKQ